VNDRTWLGDVAIELANIRNVVSLTADATPEEAQQLMCSVGRYHDTMQSYQAGIDQLERAVTSLHFESPSFVALLAELAYLHLRMANIEAAERILARASQLQEVTGPPDWNDVAVERSTGELAIRSGNYEQVIRLATETLERKVSPRGRARMWSLVGIAQCSLGEHEAGLGSLEQALALYIALDDAPHIAFAHNNVAEAAWRLQRYSVAAHHQRESLENGLAIEQRLALTTSMIMAARFADLRNDSAAAVRLYFHAQSLLRQAGHELYEGDHAAMQIAIRQAEDRLGRDAVADLTDTEHEISVIAAAEQAFAVFDHETTLTTTSSPTTR